MSSRAATSASRALQVETKISEFDRQRGEEQTGVSNFDSLGAFGLLGFWESGVSSQGEFEPIFNNTNSNRSNRVSLLGAYKGKDVQVRGQL